MGGGVSLWTLLATALLPAAAGAQPLSFGSAAVADKYFVVNSPIDPETLPAAIGGDGLVTYALSPTLPQGLLFDPDTRVLSGTPTATVARTEFTYTATDAANASVQLTFSITVAASTTLSFGGAAISDKHLLEGNPIDTETLPKATGGFGDLIYSLTPPLPLGLSFNPATRILSGTPGVAISRTEYTYTATDDSSDTAQLTFAITVEADVAPSFGGAGIDDLTFTQHEATGTVILRRLPAAMETCSTRLRRPCRRASASIR